MSRRGAIAAGALVIAAIAAWWLTREPTAASPSAARPAPVAVGATPRSPEVERAPDPASAAAEPEDPAPVIAATHDFVHAIGRQCWTTRTPRDVPPGEPDDSVGRMELRLRVEIVAGQARIAAHEVVSTRRLTDELRDCIVAGVGDASWAVEAPDGAVTIVELFRMGDYMAPGPDQPPPPRPPSR